MFRLFHLAWSTCRATKTFVAGWRNLLRKVEHGSTLSNKFWLCCLFFIKLATCLGSTPSKSTNQRVAFLLTRNNCFCCATSWSCEVKNVKHWPKTCNETMLRDKLRILYLVFRRLKRCATQTLTLSWTKGGFSVLNVLNTIRPFSCHRVPLFQSESSYKPFYMKMSVICMKMTP